jgi:multicomponent Na+:H+ antiporter subunit G
MADLIASVLVLSGGFFCLIAGIGVIRLNDVYARMHAATKAGTLGLALICAAVMVKADGWMQVLEAAFVFLFMIASAPVGAHLIGRAAFRTHNPMDPNTRSDIGCESFRTYGTPPADSPLR